MTSSSLPVGASHPSYEPTSTSVPQSQLRALVRRYALNPNLSALLPPSGERTWARLAGDRHTDVWLISWPEGTATGWHDHGAASGAFAVASGCVVEETWALGAVQRRRLVDGDSRVFGPAHVHSVFVFSPGRALTVHAYAPGLVTMGRFALEASGPARLVGRLGEESQ